MWHVISSLTTGRLTLERPGTRRQMCGDCRSPHPAHHPSLHHSSQRDKSLTVTTHRPLMGHDTQLRPSDWWINYFPGLPFADLLQRWSVSPDEKISHHLHSSSRTPALNLLYEVSERIPRPTFNIPNSHAHWDWIKMPNKIRILNRFSGVIDIFCPHVLTMSRLLPIFN